MPPSESGLLVDPATAAAGALMLALGWEQQQEGGGPRTSPEAPAAAQSLRAAVFMLFGDQLQPQGGRVLGSLAGHEPMLQQQQEQQLWQHPLARWCFAALIQRYCAAAASGSGNRAAAAVWQQDECRHLAQQFAAASYGDQLFGAAVALLLRRVVPLNCQVRVSVQECRDGGGGASAVRETSMFAFIPFHDSFLHCSLLAAGGSVHSGR